MTSMKKLLSGMIFFEISVFVLFAVLTIESIEDTLTMDSFEFVACINLFLLQFVSVYVTCHFSTTLSIKSTEMGDAVFNAPWYSLPLEQQEMIILMIQQGQVPFVLNGLWIFQCSKEIFLTV